MKTPAEEAADIEAEAQFWQEWDGQTNCFGVMAKVLFLAVVLAHSLYQLITV